MARLSDKAIRFLQAPNVAYRATVATVPMRTGNRRGRRFARDGAEVTISATVIWREAIGGKAEA